MSAPVVAIAVDAVIDLAAAAGSAAGALDTAAGAAAGVLDRHGLSRAAVDGLGDATTELDATAADIGAFVDLMAGVDAEAYLTYVLAGGTVVEVFGPAPADEAGLRALLAELTGGDTSSVPGVAAAWDGLPDALRAGLVAAAPTLVGNLDGVAFVDRAAANKRTALGLIAAFDHDVAAAQARLSALPALAGNPLLGIAPGDLTVAEARALEHLLVGAGQEGADLEARARRRAAMAQWIDDDGVLILGLTDGGDRAIVSHGNPDTADRVVTLVPGAESDPTAFREENRFYGDYWHNLADGFGEGTAAVAWIDYDAPALVVAGGDNQAQRAAADLAPFLEAVSVRGGPRDTALIGHSYGSVVAAHTGPDLDVDVLLATGRPGLRTVQSGHISLEGLFSDGDPHFPEGTTVLGGRFDDDVIRFTPDVHGPDPAGGDHPVDEVVDFGPSPRGDGLVQAHNAYGDPTAIATQVDAITEAWDR